jgi:hypothetical protein
MIVRVKLCWPVYQIYFFTLELGLYLNVEIVLCFFLSVIFNNTHLLRLLVSVVGEWIWTIGGLIQMGENWSIWTKAFFSATLFMTNPMWTSLYLNTGLRGEKPVTEPWYGHALLDFQSWLQTIKCQSPALTWVKCMWSCEFEEYF